jgi:hypothetical protein
MAAAEWGIPKSPNHKKPAIWENDPAAREKAPFFQEIFGKKREGESFNCFL